MTTHESQGMPLAPPMAAPENGGYPQTPPPFQDGGYPTQSYDQAKEPNFLKRHWQKIAIAGALAVGAVLLATNISDRDSSSVAKDKMEQIGSNSQGGPAVDACPDGTFTKENPFAVSNDVQPGDLMRRPAQQLKSDDQLYNYLMGNKNTKDEGELCVSPLALGTFNAIASSWVGDGSANARGFVDVVQDANEKASFFAEHPEDAKELLDDDEFQNFIVNFKLNEQAQKGGAYYEVFQVDNQIVQIPVTLDEMAPGTVFVVSGEVWFGDSPYASSQIAIIDSLGNTYVLNSLGGVPNVAPPETTTTTSTSIPAGSSETQTDGQNQGQQSTGGSSNAEGDPNTGSGGGCGGCGKGGGGGTGGGNGSGNGGGGNGGGGNGGGGGGGCGECGGGGSTPTNPNNPEPTPTTPSTPSTPTTQPKGDPTPTIPPTSDPNNPWG